MPIERGCWSAARTDVDSTSAPTFHDFRMYLAVRHVFLCSTPISRVGVRSTRTLRARESLVYVNLAAYREKRQYGLVTTAEVLISLLVSEDDVVYISLLAIARTSKVTLPNP